MFDFKHINEAKSKTKESEQARTDNAEELYEAGLKEIEAFKNTDEKIHLEAAVKNLTESIALKKTDPRPYIKLAFLFYVIDEITMSVKYLNVAKSLDPKLPDVIKLQNLISEEKY